MKNTFSPVLLPAMMLAFAASFVSAAPVKGRSNAIEQPPQELHAEITINPVELAPDSTIEVDVVEWVVEGL